MDDSEAQFALTSFSRRLWHRLAPELPADVEYDRCGTLWVAADEPGDGRGSPQGRLLRRSRRGGGSAGSAGLGGGRAEPVVAIWWADCCVMDDAVIYPPAAARYLLEQATAPRGRGPHRRRGPMPVRDDGEVVLADGEPDLRRPGGQRRRLRSPALTPGLPVRRRKGHLVITDRYPGYVRHQIVELGYLKSAHSPPRIPSRSTSSPARPARCSSARRASSAQTTSDVEAAILDRMLRRALEYLPSLRQALRDPLLDRHRAATPDKLPLIGPSPSSDRIWLATGHEGLGITTSLATGQTGGGSYPWNGPPRSRLSPTFPAGWLGGPLHG